MSAFVTPLRVEWMDDKHWRLLEPLMYESAVLGRTIIVPAGFVTDFASVPRLPIAWLLAGGRGPRAATIHDWLCAHPEECSWTMGAQVLLEALALDGVDPVTATLMYNAVLQHGIHRGAVPIPGLGSERGGAVVEGP